MTAVSAFIAALKEEHDRAHAQLRAAAESEDDVGRTLALNRLADLQDIVTRSLDVVSLEALEGRRRLPAAPDSEIA